MNYVNLTQIKDLTIRESLRKIIDAVRGVENRTHLESLFGTHNERPNPQDNPTGTIYRETDRLATYKVIDTGNGAKVWEAQEGVGGPMLGTLSPDQKPTDLGVFDEGFRFYSTDYGREYRWTSTAGTMGWLDSPGAPARWQIIIFHHPPEPLQGWALCDGGAYVRSTLDGQTTPVVTPDLTTGALYLRAGALGFAGSVGGTTTHTHDVTPASVQVAAGAGIFVGDDVAVTTTAATHLPPFYQGIPYMRI